MNRVFLLLSLLVASACSDGPYEETSTGNYIVLTTEAEGVGGFGYVHKDSLDILVQVLDRDLDGNPDGIAYSSLPSANGRRVRVADYDFDGQADERRFDDSTTEIWFDGDWYLVTEESDGLQIEVRGRPVLVREGDYGHLYVTVE